MSAPRQKPNSCTAANCRVWSISIRAIDIIGFDYGAPAELFPRRNKGQAVQARYKRFDTAAEAVRFAIEEIPERALSDTYLEVDEARFGVDEIKYLYHHAAFPLERAIRTK